MARVDQPQEPRAVKRGKGAKASPARRRSAVPVAPKRLLAPVLVEDIEDYFRYGFDPDDPTLHFSDAELRGIPRPIFAGMYLCAWARAEFVPVCLFAGRPLELWCRYEPSPALHSAFTKHYLDVAGVLGWATELRYNDDRRPFGVGPALTFGNSGRGSRN
jgi:hypothetical protein